MTQIDTTGAIVKAIDEFKYCRKELEKYADGELYDDYEGDGVYLKNDTWKQCENIDKMIATLQAVLGELPNDLYLVALEQQSLKPVKVALDATKLLHKITQKEETNETD